MPEEREKVKCKTELEFITEVADDCVANLKDKDREHLIRNPYAIDYHFSYCLYIRNHYIHNRDFSDVDFWTEPDDLSSEIIRLIFAKLIPEYDYDNQFIENLFDDKRFIQLRQEYRAIYGDYPVAMVEEYKEGIEYKGKPVEDNANERRFWNSLIHWFETELPSMELLKGKYLQWDNLDGGMWFLDLDYDHEFTLYRGTTYPDSLRNNTGDMIDIKAFIEIAYKYWIVNSRECRYKFTIEVNDRLKIFKLPYRLQSGILIKQGYKTSFPIDKIINYRMFERKIQFSEDMINSKDLMEKKSALDFIIDALQYLISTQGDSRNEQYKALALSVSDNMDGKVYAVVKKELEELMKLSNEYFDVRHNDYLNAAKRSSTIKGYNGKWLS